MLKGGLSGTEGLQVDEGLSGKGGLKFLGEDLNNRKGELIFKEELKFLGENLNLRKRELKFLGEVLNLRKGKLKFLGEILTMRKGDLKILGEILTMRKGDLKVLLELARRPRPLPLFRHALLKARQIQPQLALAGDVGGQVDGKPVGVVELEHIVPRDGVGGQLGDGGIQVFKPLLQGFGKALLFLPQGVLHPLPGRGQHRMGAAHDVMQGGR